MITVGLTGSIATGKSETGRMFAARGVPVLEADAIVHSLYARGGAVVGPIAALAPETLRDGAIDRARLSSILQEQPQLLPAIEAITHPLVRAAQLDFIARMEKAAHRFALLDIPLLFEKDRIGDVDKIIVTTCDPDVQRTRAMARPGMTVEKLEWILARQMPSADKVTRADFIIDTGHGLEAAGRRVDEIIAALGGV